MILDDVDRAMRGRFGRREPADAEVPGGAVSEGSAARVVTASP